MMKNKKVEIHFQIFVFELLVSAPALVVDDVEVVCNIAKRKLSSFSLSILLLLPTHGPPPFCPYGNDTFSSTCLMSY